MKTRFNPVTGQEEFWNEPPGLPGVWMPRGLCARCKPFQHCLGLMELTDEAWKGLEQYITSITDPKILQLRLNGCGAQPKSCNI